MDGETDVAIDRCSRDMKGTDERSDENESEGARGRAGKRYGVTVESYNICMPINQPLTEDVVLGGVLEEGVTSATKSLRR